MGAPSTGEAVSGWRRAFALDLRSLGLARIALASLLLVDLALRARDLEAHYTDSGVLPRAALHLNAFDFAWSIHALGGGFGFEAGLFAVAAGFGLLLLVGYRTPWASLGAWALTVSLHGRNPLLRDGQDDLLRVLLFWALFLPWGRCWSVDAWRRAEGWRGPPGVVSSPGTVGYTAQVIALYASSALAKVQSPFWRGGGGIAYALGIARYATPAGQWLLGWPRVLAGAGWAVMGVELLAPLLLLVPWRVERLRAVLVPSFLALHAGFLLGLRLGAFPFMCMAMWLPFVTPRARPANGQGATERRAPGWAWAGVSALIAAVALCNAKNLDRRLPIPAAVGHVAAVLGLQQYWTVFAPPRLTPEALTDGWFVVAGSRRAGGPVDLLRQGKPLTWEPPSAGAPVYPNARWRQYFARITDDWPRGSEAEDTMEKSRAALGRWLCRRWNDGRLPGEQVSLIQLVYVHRRMDRPREESGRAIRGSQACQAPAAAGGPGPVSGAGPW